MLLYDNQSFWRVIFQVKGSIFVRARTLACGLMISAASGVMAWLISEKHDLAPSLPHHYGILGISSIVVFAIVFRMNLAWARYWEAMSQQHLMYSKWADAFAQFCAFANVTITTFNIRDGGDYEDNPESDLIAKSHKIINTMRNLKKHFSLLSAVSADRLTHGDTRIMEKKARKDTWKGQVMLRGDLRSDPDWERYLELPQFAQMGRSIQRSRMSIEELEERDKLGWKQRFFVTECPNEEEARYLNESTDRVGTVMYWILHDLATVSNDLLVAPPIQSRMFQELSNGMLGFSNSLKIADVPFPFPYAQLMNIMLMTFSFFIPVYVSVFTTSVVASTILAFCFFEGLWCFNNVAQELENPFGCHANGISLEDFHMRFMHTMRDLEPAQEFKNVTFVTTMEQIVSSRETVRMSEVESPQFPRQIDRGLEWGSFGRSGGPRLPTPRGRMMTPESSLGRTSGSSHNAGAFADKRARQNRVFAAVNSDKHNFDSLGEENAPESVVVEVSNGKPHILDQDKQPSAGSGSLPSFNGHRQDRRPSPARTSPSRSRDQDEEVHHVNGSRLPEQQQQQQQGRTPSGDVPRERFPSDGSPLRSAANKGDAARRNDG